MPTQVAAGASSQQQQQQQRHSLISGSGDGTIRLWDVDSGKQLECYVASEQPPPLAFQQQQQEAGAVQEPEQQQEQGEGDADEDQQQGEGGEEQGGSKTDAAAGQQQDAGGEPDKQQQGEAAEGQDRRNAARYHKLREACCAVLSIAVSPDGSTVAAAVEGQQDLQLLSLDAASGQLQLLQKLAFADVANPAAVAFDSAGRLWAVGGVLARDTESAHIGVAARSAGGLACAAAMAFGLR